MEFIGKGQPLSRRHWGQIFSLDFDGSLRDGWSCQGKNVLDMEKIKDDRVHRREPLGQMYRT